MKFVSLSDICNQNFYFFVFSDGLSQQLGGCLRDFRNKPFPVRAKIEYYKNVLTVSLIASVLG